MILGTVQGRSPRARLTLPGGDGDLEIEFVVDTGFEGELALPHSLASRLEVIAVEKCLIVMADGQPRQCLRSYLWLDWEDAARRVEVLLLDGNPLLGMGLMEGCHLHMEVADGGEIVLDTL